MVEQIVVSCKNTPWLFGFHRANLLPSLAMLAFSAVWCLHNIIYYAEITSDIDLYLCIYTQVYRHAVWQYRSTVREGRGRRRETHGVMDVVWDTLSEVDES